ncbi:MAG: hypothetical protein M0Z60_04135 [Nitrospiraceae bacterium]|nr:hypothetical protein [Nitrospiraceae bacterium]
MKDSAVTCSLAKGFGEFFRELLSRTRLRVDQDDIPGEGAGRAGECPARARMSELMEREEPFGKTAA